MNVKYIQSYFDINLNIDVTISFEPSQNDATTQVEIQLPPQTIVISSLQLLSWNNDVEIGVSNSQQALFSIKMDAVENNYTIATEYKTYFFDSIINPYKTINKQFELHDGKPDFNPPVPNTILNIETYDSNTITIEMPIMDTLIFKQDVYSTITPQIVSHSTKYVTDVELSCIDRFSFYLKNIPPIILKHTIDELEQGGAAGFDIVTTKFAFDWFCNQEGLFRITNGLITEENKWWKDQAQLATIISGQPAKNGVYIDNSDNNRVLDNYYVSEFNDNDSTTKVEGEARFATSFPARYKVTDTGVYFDTAAGQGNALDYYGWNKRYYNYNKWNSKNNGNERRHQGCNGFSELRFLSLSTLGSWIGKSVTAITDIPVGGFKFNVNYFHKQNYENPMVAGDPVEPLNAWILYKVIGAGDIITSGISGSTTFYQNEEYLSSDDFIETFAGSYSSIYDLISDISLSTLEGSVISRDTLLTTNRFNVVDINIIDSPINVDISFGYSKINIQTGSTDPAANDNTINVVTAPGSGQNLNIPMFFNCYPIDPKNAINHTFVPIVYNRDVTLDAADIYQSAHVTYLADTITSTQTYAGIPGTLMLMDRQGTMNPMFENWGNAGFYFYSGNEVMDAIPPSSDYNEAFKRWNIYNTGAPYTDIGTNKSYRGLDNDMMWTEPGTRSQARRPFQALHLNDVNWSPFKIWYLEKYSNMEYLGGNMKATFPDRYTMVAASPMWWNYYQNTAQAEWSPWQFDWRVDNVGSAPDYVDSNIWGGARTNRLIDTPVTQSYTRDFLIENLKLYRDMAMYSWDKYWVDTINSNLNDADEQYISLIVTLTMKPQYYKMLFSDYVHQNYGYLGTLVDAYYYKLYITDNPYQQSLNTVYKCIGWDFDGNDIILKFARATKKELDKIGYTG